MQVTRELDTKGLKCPMPVLKTKKAMKQLAPGETLRVEATDSSAVKDFAAFCAASNHLLIESTELEGIFTFILKKSI